MSANLHALQRRLNAQAYPLLHAELARLAAENESLRSQLNHAEDDAEFWCEQCMGQRDAQAHAEGGTVGMALSGHLVVVPAHTAAAGHA